MNQIKTNKNIDRGIIVGRLQPIHNGHVKVIETILKEVNELIIVIGSAQYSHSLDNPFTAGERSTMVKEALNEVDIDSNRYYIIPIQDISNHYLWVHHIKMLTPLFNKVYSGNPLVRRLFSENGYNVEKIKPFNRDEFSGRQIRKNIAEDKKWKDSVPKSVAKFIEEIDGINRIKQISEKELNEL